MSTGDADGGPKSAITVGRFRECAARRNLAYMNNISPVSKHILMDCLQANEDTLLRRQQV